MMAVIKRAMFAAAIGVMMMCAAADPRMETTIELAVPKPVAAEASIRASGDASATAPVLMLEGVEVIAGERMTIEVLGPADAKTKKRPILAVSGIVGSGKPPADAPKQTMDLIVPLNEKAARFIAKSETIKLTLRLRNGSHPLKLKRAYFATGK